MFWRTDFWQQNARVKRGLSTVITIHLAHTCVLSILTKLLGADTVFGLQKLKYQLHVIERSPQILTHYLSQVFHKDFRETWSQVSTWCGQAWWLLPPVRGNVGPPFPCPGFPPLVKWGMWKRALPLTYSHSSRLNTEINLVEILKIRLWGKF